MAGGVWSPTNKPIRPGFYMNIEAAAVAAISGGSRGIITIPVKANWGPPKEVVEVKDENELIKKFGTDVGSGFTAYEAVRLVLLGKPKLVKVYRLNDGNGAPATITLQDSASLNVLKLDTKYPTTRPFKVTVRDNLVDSNKQDIVLYEGSTQLYVFTFSKGSVDNAVAAINNDSNNEWIFATKVASGNGTLKNVTSQSLTGGNAGIASITNSHYIEAMAAFEAQEFNGFTLDGATDSSLQTSVKSWVERLRNEGKKVIAYMGGTEANDLDVNAGNTRSQGFNHEGVVNVTVSGKLNGKWYSSAMVACFVAGLGTGQALRESLTYAVTPFEDVKPRLTHSQIESALKAGSLVLVHDGQKVVIEQGINTLTSLRVGQNNSFKKIKAIRIMDAIETDTTKAAHDNYIGKVLNNADGQAAVLSAIKNYFSTLSPTLIAPDFKVEVDAEKQATAEGDQFFWKWEATIIDSMEKIFGTGIIR
jgi:hypothetical protein